MGLFDKRKKSDDFDSPVESIDLSAPPEPSPPESFASATPPPLAAPGAAAEAPGGAAMSAPPRAAETREQRAVPRPEPEDDFYDAPPYGIDDAIQLMRALPQDNVELVVQVVKRTLESTKVKVKTIIDDATRKQDNIEGRIGVLKREIDEYEQEISTRQQEIGKLEADHSETTTVKERLVLAEQLTRSGKAGDTATDDKSSTAPPPSRPSSTSTSPSSSMAGNAPPTPGSALPPRSSTTIVAKK